MERVHLATLYDVALAEIMRGRLEADGIEAWTTGSGTASLYGGLTGVGLWVRGCDEALARQVLQLPQD